MKNKYVGCVVSRVLINMLNGDSFEKAHKKAQKLKYDDRSGILADGEKWATKDVPMVAANDSCTKRSKTARSRAK